MRTVAFLIALLLPYSLGTKRCTLNLQSHNNYHLINGETCGQVFQNRIIGGENARLGQYPWVAQFILETDDSTPSSPIVFCAGAILNDMYVVTATHCFPDIIDIDIGKVVLGEHTTSQDPDCELGVCAPSVQYRSIDSVIRHPAYNRRTFLNDITLVRLTTPIQFNDYVKPICLHANGHVLNLTNEWAEVAGWGSTDPEKSITSDVLQTLKLEISSESKCASDYRRTMRIKPKGNIPLICAGGVPGQDTCRGDSGGPMMKILTEDGQPRYYLIGVGSFGPKICGRGGLAFFTDVTKFIRWVLDNIEP